jgi:hypothetical protein
LVCGGEGSVLRFNKSAGLPIWAREALYSAQLYRRACLAIATPFQLHLLQSAVAPSLKLRAMPQVGYNFLFLEQIELCIPATPLQT